MKQNRDGEQKSYKLFGHFSLVVLLSLTSLNAQSFEDFKRSQAKSFSKYKDERDNAFNKYLKAQWKAYNVHKGTPLYEKPKPIEIIPAKPKPIKSVGPKIRVLVKKVKHIEPKAVQKFIKLPPKVVKVDKVVKVEKIAKVKKTPKVVRVAKKDINFNFYGSDLGFNVASGIKKARFSPQNKKGIANFFDKVASSEHKELVQEIQRIQKVMNLNDWALYQLVNKISNSVYSNKDNSNLLSWFLFNKLGYAVKVGIAKKHTVLMHYSKKVIYSTPNYNISKKKFYVVANYNKGDVGGLYSYPQNYPDADKPMNLSLKTLPKFSSDMKKKTLNFKHSGKGYKLSYEYNKNIVDFMGTYPQADYDTYFNSPLDSRTYASIAKGLKKHIDGMQASDAINFVLHFVQTAFDYQRDDEQFGREKVMFGMETLHFRKSDCEDRAILFSYLIKEMFGIGVVGVKYKDHMATALHIPMEGDSVKAGTTKLIVADPTYINANLGQAMPRYRSMIPSNFIVVKG